MVQDNTPSATLSATGGLDLGELQSFRSEVADWLRAHVPADWRAQMTGASHDAYRAFQRSWLEELREAGYAAPHWPKEWGGGFTFGQRVVLAEEQARAGAPRPSMYFMGLYHAAGALLGAGTRAQQEQHLPRILAGEVWCQGFSEPEAGSDLASLRTRAVRHGDVYRVNGQKVWSSHAHEADYCLLLVRTDPDVPKRRGISFLIMDMQSPGIQVRPIIQSTGQSEFNEMFLDNVEIPVANLIGDENDGWNVSQRTLSAERGTTSLELIERLRVTRDRLAEDVRSAVRRSDPDRRGALLQQYAAVHAEVEVLHLICYRMLGDLAIGHAGPSASIIKLYYSEVLQRLSNFGTLAGGLAAQLQQEPRYGVDWESGVWLIDYIGSWGWTIGGGTSEVLRNVVAERVLGLPRDPVVPR
jgi:alkylation response protein AidB-like acyl-CoA dehydrogenase